MRSPYFILPVLMAFAGAYYLYARERTTASAGSSLSPPEKPNSNKNVTIPDEPMHLKPFEGFKFKQKSEQNVTKHSKDKYFTWPWANKRLKSLLTIGAETYEFQETIGQGGDGKVKKVTNSKGVTYAVKIIDANQNESVDDAIKNTGNIDELVDYGDATAFSSKHYLVLPYIEGTNFFDVLHNQNAFQQKNRISFDQQLLYAESFLETFLPYHLRGYKIHDVKPENYIWDDKNKKMHRIDKDDVVEEKIIINYSRSYGYLAPEASYNHDNNYKILSDVFGAGVVLMQIFNPKLEIKNSEEMPASGKFHEHEQQYYSTRPDSELGRALWNVCKEMVDPAPANRPTIPQVIEKIKSIRNNFSQEINEKIDREKPEDEIWRKKNETDKSRIAGFKQNISGIDNIKDLVLTYEALLRDNSICRLGKRHKNESEKNLNALKKQFISIVYTRSLGERQDDPYSNFHNALHKIKKEAENDNCLYNLYSLLNHNVNVSYDYHFRYRIGGAKTYSWFYAATEENDASAAADLLDKFNDFKPARRFCF